MSKISQAENSSRSIDISGFRDNRSSNDNSQNASNTNKDIVMSRKASKLSHEDNEITPIKETEYSIYLKDKEVSYDILKDTGIKESFKNLEDHLLDL